MYIQYCAEVLCTLVFSPQRNGFNPVIYIFCCSVSVGNISLHFQTLIVPLIVIIQWNFWIHKDSDTIQKKNHWIITINGTINVWKCKL